ncbi:hypothetical protein AXX17_AT3G35200 [Arabidopsis thaliana]|uniref:Uncharacterized protein n=1 Tax=Arabidopsis thaliana TaxID=3702 RepID=A0A178VIY5_ARATH|nr:hypothetical protein AXX17_AT3G35200 [Arabidopsis thaliana]
MISSSFSHCQRDLDPGSPLSSRSYILHARDFSFSIKLDREYLKVAKTGFGPKRERMHRMGRKNG